MDLFIHMYDIYDEYRAAPDDRLNAIFRNHDFYSRIREFTLDGQVDVLSYILPQGYHSPIPFDFPLDHTLGDRPEYTNDWRDCNQKIGRPIDPGTPGGIILKLTHLSLTDFPLHPKRRPIVKQLLLVLQANPDLEKLIYHDGLKVDDEDLPFVSFTRLRILRMASQIQSMASLLRHLRIVSEVEEIERKIEALESRRGPTLSAVPSFLNDAVSPRAVPSIKARPASNMFRPGVTYVRNSDSTQCPNLPHHSSFVELRFERALELSAFLALGILQNATRLELSLDDFQSPWYLGIFEMVPMIQELVTWGGRECNSVRALLPNAQDSSEDVGDSIYPSYVPLRNLSHLRIIEADLRDTEDEDGPPNETAILSFVRQRKLLGLGLQRLELVYCQYVSPDWVDELRLFVPDTFWDGQGGVGEEGSDEDYCPSSSDPDDSESDDSDEDSGSDEGDTVFSESTDWMLKALFGGERSLAPLEARRRCVEVVTENYPNEIVDG